MSETVYRKIDNNAVNLLAYEPITPNPLDEVERLKADITALSDGPGVDEWMRMVEFRDRLLRQVLRAIDSGRHEPLMAIRDVVRNHLEDLDAQPVEEVTP